MKGFQINDELLIKVDSFIDDTLIIKVIGIDDYNWIFSVIETRYNKFFVNEILKYNPVSDSVIRYNGYEFDIIDINPLTPTKM